MVRSTSEETWVDPLSELAFVKLCFFFTEQARAGTSRGVPWKKRLRTSLGLWPTRAKKRGVAYLYSECDQSERVSDSHTTLVSLMCKAGVMLSLFKQGQRSREATPRTNPPVKVILPQKIEHFETTPGRGGEEHRMYNHTPLGWARCFAIWIWGSCPQEQFKSRQTPNLVGFPFQKSHCQFLSISISYNNKISFANLARDLPKRPCSRFIRIMLFLEGWPRSGKLKTGMAVLKNWEWRAFAKRFATI